MPGVPQLEAAVREMPEWVLLRNGLLYGPDTWYAPDGLMARRARAGELAADDDVTSFVHVDDAAEAALAALTWPTGATNVCDDEPAPARIWVPAFCRAVGAPAPAAADGPGRAPAGPAAPTTTGHVHWGGRPVTRPGATDSPSCATP